MISIKRLRFGWRELGGCAFIATVTCAIATLVMFGGNRQRLSTRFDISSINGRCQPVVIPAGLSIGDYVSVEAVAMSPMVFSLSDEKRVERRHLWILSRIDWWITDGIHVNAPRISRDALLRGELPEVWRRERVDRGIETSAEWFAVGPISYSVISKPIIHVLVTDIPEATDEALEVTVTFRIHASSGRVRQAIAAFVIMTLIVTAAIAAVYRRKSSQTSIRRLMPRAGNSIKKS
jgi:hypothetical protein